jgi:hypothetical protein
MSASLAAKLHTGSPLLAILALFLLFAAFLAIAWAPLQRDARLRRQLAQVRDAYAAIGSAASANKPASPLARAVAGVGSLLTGSGLLSPKAIANLESTLASAGMRGNRALPLFVGAKVLLLIGLPLLAFLLLRNTSLSGTWQNLLLAVSAIAGLMAPDTFLSSIRKRYLAPGDLRRSRARAGARHGTGRRRDPHQQPGLRGGTVADPQRASGVSGSPHRAHQHGPPHRIAQLAALGRHPRPGVAIRHPVEPSVAVARR